MGWSEIEGKEPVLKAMAEYDRVGREKFLAKYGFKPSTKFFVRYKRRLYDVKALAGAAWGYAFPKQGPKASADFSSGKPLLDFDARLGLEVVEPAPEDRPALPTPSKPKEAE